MATYKFAEPYICSISYKGFMEKRGVAPAVALLVLVLFADRCDRNGTNRPVLHVKPSFES